RRDIEIVDSLRRIQEQDFDASEIDRRRARQRTVNQLTAIDRVVEVAEEAGVVDGQIIDAGAKIDVEILQSHGKCAVKVQCHLVVGGADGTFHCNRGNAGEFQN